MAKRWVYQMQQMLSDHTTPHVASDLSSAPANPLMVSVLIPSHNYARFLDQAITSVFEQRFESLEIIVCDDGSKDDTQAVLAGYGDRIRHVRNEKAQGAGAARNRILRMARGKYVALLDADDIWLPGKLRQQVDVMEADDGVALCHTAYEYFGNPEKDGPQIAHRDYWFHGHCFEQIWKFNTIHTSSVLLRRSAMPAFGFAEDVKVVEDWEMWMNMLFTERAYYIPEVHTRYRLHPAQTISWGGVRSLVYRALPRFRLLERIKGKVDDATHAEMKSFASEQLWEHAYSRYWNGDFATARLGFQWLRRFTDKRVPMKHRVVAAVRAMIKR